MLRSIGIRLISLCLGASVMTTGLTLPMQTRVDSPDSDRFAILEVLKNQQANWNKGDVDAFLEGYWHSPELTFCGTGGIARGWDAVRARYEKNYADRETMGPCRTAHLKHLRMTPLGVWNWNSARRAKACPQRTQCPRLTG